MWEDRAPGHALQLGHLLVAVGTGYRGNTVSGQSTQEFVFPKFVHFFFFLVIGEALAIRAIRESESCT